MLASDDDFHHRRTVCPGTLVNAGPNYIGRHSEPVDIYMFNLRIVKSLGPYVVVTT